MRKFEFAVKLVGGDKRTPIMNENNETEKQYPNAKMPEYATPGSAGADFFAAESVIIPSIWNKLSKLLSSSDKENIKINEPTLVHTGIKACMGENEVLELYNRSSNPKKLGLVLANSVGIVDSDYYSNKDNDGEIMFAFYNFSSKDVFIQAGDKIGQGVFKQFLKPENAIIVKNERSGGFGSTDNK